MIPMITISEPPSGETTFGVTDRMVGIIVVLYIASSYFANPTSRINISGFQEPASRIGILLIDSNEQVI